MTEAYARTGSITSRSGGRRSRPVPVRVPGTYRVQHDSLLLAEHVRLLAPGRRVLDVCTGSGYLALTAAGVGASTVTAVDIARPAVASTRLNSLLLRARVGVRRGDLFAPVDGQRFDLVVCNPPYVPAPTDVLPTRGVARAWDGATSGRAVLDRVCDDVAGVLAPGGTVALVHSSVIGEDRTIERLAARGVQAEVVCRRLIPFGPVMTNRADWLRSRGLLAPDEEEETLVVVVGRLA